MSMKVEADEASESALLSLLIEEPQNLDSPDFTPALLSGERKDLAKCFLTLRSKAQPITPENVLLVSKSEELSLLAAKLRTRSLGGSFQLLIERLKEVRIRAKVSSICRKHYDAAYDESKDYKTLVAEFERDAMSIRTTKASNLVSGSDYQHLLDVIEWRNENPDAIRGVPSGFSRLDDALDGILPYFYVIGGRPSTGKTAFALNICESLCSQGGRVLFFSAETSPEIIQQRMLSIMAGVPLGRIGRPHSPVERKKIMAALPRLSQFDWHIDPTSSPSIGHMEATIRRLHKEKPITAVFGDYIQLFTGRGTKKGIARYEEVGEISAGCKAIVKDFNIPVIMLAQLQRPEQGVYDRVEKKTITPRPQLHNLRESGNIEQDADVVLALYRNQEENSPKSEVIILKQKDGGLETVNMTFQPECYKFTES